MRFFLEIKCRRVYIVFPTLCRGDHAPDSMPTISLPYRVAYHVVGVLDYTEGRQRFIKLYEALPRAKKLHDQT